MSTCGDRDPAQGDVCDERPAVDVSAFIDVGDDFEEPGELSSYFVR